MYKVTHVKKGRHGMPYVYFIIRVVEHFGVISEKETLEIEK